VSEGKISPHEAQELEVCFRAHARELFGYACAVTRGDQALAHAVALLRWGLDMKEGEIAAVLGVAEKTVSVHLYRVRRKLLLQLGADYPFGNGAPEGGSS
jgi:sigma-70-like protein